MTEPKGLLMAVSCHLQTPTQKDAEVTQPSRKSTLSNKMSRPGSFSLVMVREFIGQYYESGTVVAFTSQLPGRVWEEDD